MTPLDELSAGEVGYIATGLKTVEDCQVGDTITLATTRPSRPLPGYRPAKPMVFAGLYPVESTDYPLLRDALEKLQAQRRLALLSSPRPRSALGFGFRCGFLGLLHMEIVQERLEREYNLDLLTTAPSVEYQVLHHRRRGASPSTTRPTCPTAGEIGRSREPWMKISIITPTRYIGTIMELVTGRRGVFEQHGVPGRAAGACCSYRIPLSEMLVDFYDQLKSRTQGYASLDYTFADYQAGRPGQAGHPGERHAGGRALADRPPRQRLRPGPRAGRSKLRKLIPRQMFEVPIQAAIGSQDHRPRERSRAMRKNVLAKCYGGDITRKRKLLEKQTEGKKRMKRVGNVEIPQEAFMAVLSLGEGGFDDD